MDTLKADRIPRPATISTGIYVRALVNGEPSSVDIAQLDRASLLCWLRSRGGHNPWAESTVLLLLGHIGLSDDELE